jgi:hypothetical protein
MAKTKRVILYGEGKEDAIFLRHIWQHYQSEHPGIICKTYAGNGGSPAQVVQGLIKKHLSLANYDGALVLLDEDQGTTGIHQRDLQTHNIHVILSKPVCLEGLILKTCQPATTVGPGTTAKKLKSQFRKELLETDQGSGLSQLFKKKCPTLLPRKILDQAQPNLQTLKEIQNWFSQF